MQEYKAAFFILESPRRAALRNSARKALTIFSSSSPSNIFKDTFFKWVKKIFFHSLDRYACDFEITNMLLKGKQKKDWANHS